MSRGKLLVLVVAFAVLGAACGGGGGTRVHAVRHVATTVPATTTTTAAAAPTAPSRPVRIHALPGEPSAPRAAVHRGPTSTGRIIIPSIGLNHPTFEGIDLATIDYGPSHWPGTAMPGDVGNTTFAGHRVTHTHPFFNIDLIKTGDQVIFENANGRYTYEATDEFVVDASETWIADPTDTATFTIFGCHPKHQATQRYVVKGKLVKAEKTPPPAPPPSNTGANSGGSSGDQPPSTPPDPQPTTTTTCILCIG